jgi:flagellar motor switch protein FliG
MVREKMGDLAQSRVNNTPKARHEILEMVRQLAEEGKINLNEGMALSVNSDAGPAIWNEDFE